MQAQAQTRRELTPQKKRLFTAIMVAALAVFFALGLLVAEMVARGSEKGFASTLRNQPDPTLGWVPAAGPYQDASPEFDTHGSINAWHMNDREWTPADSRRPNRVLAVGDSHTFAVGVSSAETWPKRIEAGLFQGRESEGVVMNAGVAGYSLGQYLERYRILRDSIKPTVLVVGLSVATDFYDLIPPERGGFVYGGDAERVFFDIGADGRLLERVHRHRPATVSAAGATAKGGGGASTSIRSYLGSHSALYRRLKRSRLATLVATYYHPGGESLWPGTDTALKVQLDEQDRYRWTLAELLIAKMAEEAKANHTRMVLVEIPYLAQVYDSVWSSSFGLRKGVYDREIPGRRLAAICTKYDVEFVDTTPAFIEATRQRGRWLHWRLDAHPTPEGQQLIADVVGAELARRGLVTAGGTTAAP